MRFACKQLLMITIAVALATAQNPIQNVILIIQENRTPDNLFQELCSSSIGCSTSDGTKFNIASSGSCFGTQVQLGSRPLSDCADPYHLHPNWEEMYDSGNMDGACSIPVVGNCGTPYQCPNNINGETDCRQYSYVSNQPAQGGNGFGMIQPYLELAEQYGWANYMFQTNQGPSFPAHQFLLSGTSAPNEDTPYYRYFAADNPSNGNTEAGCIAESGTTETLIRALIDMTNQSCDDPKAVTGHRIMRSLD